MLSEFAPDVVIGVGGYASGPAMLAAVVKHIPTLALSRTWFRDLPTAWWRGLYLVRQCILRRRQNIFVTRK